MNGNHICSALKLYNYLFDSQEDVYRLVCAGINNHFGTGYEAEDVLFVLDTINGNDDLKQRFYTATAEEIIESFNANNDIVTSMELVNLIPFTAVCIQEKCNSQPLPTHKLHQIVTLMQRDFSSSCGIYYSTCNECKTRYFPTFYELNGSKMKFITIDSIRKKNAMYFGGKTAYEYLLFLEFEAQLVHNYAAFNGFCDAHNYKLEMLNSQSSSTKTTTNERHKLDPKLFQMNWLTYQLARFVFMLTDNNCCHIPSSFDSKVEKDQYFLKYFEIFYSIFVGFWSRHKVLTEKGLTKCKVDTCSKVFISDGHQKANRSVCAFDNICDISIPELGPILVGCCGTPMKVIKNGE
ncbi:unnamed protein product [Didymodactylos carnosus]|uniref:Uncharacterized protein n=1 Tax=Didymodactylos carnosus TaxID=1234261 RepID=A0A8S2DND2_9BILA|nr:unnamed protein product [Didymodactylos carnosus]CAF3735978.1 unnamed protein product [Didymodactylos carnosus]